MYLLSMGKYVQIDDLYRLIESLSFQHQLDQVI